MARTEERLTCDLGTQLIGCLGLALELETVLKASRPLGEVLTATHSPATQPSEVS